MRLSPADGSALRMAVGVAAAAAAAAAAVAAAMEIVLVEGGKVRVVAAGVGAGAEPVGLREAEESGPSKVRMVFLCRAAGPFFHTKRAVGSFVPWSV